MDNFSRKYFELLTVDFKSINLTRINDFNDFELKQIQDSLSPLKQSGIFQESIKNTELIVDIGFGGGFPILPLAHKLPNKYFLGIEARNKKCSVVTEIAEKLELNNVKLIHSRIENIAFDVDCVCTLKAVGKVGDFLNKINTYCNMTVFFYKGPGFYEQEADQLNEIQKEWELICEDELEVEGTERRILIGFKNKNKEKRLKMSNQLVKVSSFI